MSPEATALLCFALCAAACTAYAVRRLLGSLSDNSRAKLELARGTLALRVDHLDKKKTGRHERLTIGTGEPCPQCRNTCEECSGAGEVQCRFAGCGGQGHIVHAEHWCTAEGCAAKTGYRNPGCTECHGAGRVIDQQGDCPECKGTKKQLCPICHGTQAMSTGRQGGAYDPHAGVQPFLTYRKGSIHTPRPPLCSACQGTGQKQRLRTEAERASDAAIQREAEKIRAMHRKVKA